MNEKFNHYFALSNYIHSPFIFPESLKNVPQYNVVHILIFSVTTNIYSLIVNIA